MNDVLTDYKFRLNFKRRMRMKIGVIGLGYVGLSNALLLSKKADVYAFDITEAKRKLLKEKKSPIADKEIETYLTHDDINFKVVDTLNDAVNEMEYIIIATPTNYDEEINNFDTSSVDKTIDFITEVNPNCLIIIKSTIPIGYVKNKIFETGNSNIVFSPEFLREGKALYDNLYPSRIIFGNDSKKIKEFVSVLINCIEKKGVEVLYTNTIEAEAIKLFSNTYLALRISFFNELDTFAEMKGLNSQDIIKGICLDPRIGDYYNNPSFGYGGYCLPKDTKQLKANYEEIPNSLITAVVEANVIRKNFISEQIIKMKPRTVGIYRATMKANSDNFRESSIQKIIENLANNGVTVIIYEPLIQGDYFLGARIINNFNEFAENSDIIVANRMTNQISKYKEKVYTRDITGCD